MILEQRTSKNFPKKRGFQQQLRNRSYSYIHSRICSNYIKQVPRRNKYHRNLPCRKCLGSLWKRGVPNTVRLKKAHKKTARLERLCCLIRKAQKTPACANIKPRISEKKSMLSAAPWPHRL